MTVWGESILKVLFIISWWAIREKALERDALEDVNNQQISSCYKVLHH
jgi:hypothetical protein